MARWHSGGGIRGAGGLRARPAEDAPALHRTGARPVPSPCRWLMGACVHFARFRTKIKTLSNGSTSVWQTQWVRAPMSAWTLHFPLPKTLCPPQGAEGRLGDEASAVTSCPHSLGRALLLANSLRRNTSVPSCSRKTRTCFLEMRPLTQNFITRRWRGAGLPPRAWGCVAPGAGPHVTVLPRHVVWLLSRGQSADLMLFSEGRRRLPGSRALAGASATAPTASRSGPLDPWATPRSRHLAAPHLPGASAETARAP